MSAVYNDDDYLLTFAVRITSIAIAAYDFFETYPSAFKFYRHHYRERRGINATLILFMAIRVSSILVLCISSYGFFGSFSQKGCDHYFLTAPSFKVIQGMISHCILGLRAYTVSGKNKLIGWLMAALFLVVITFEWISTVGGRVAIVEVTSTCRAKSVDVKTIYSAWLYYALTIVFDVSTTAITVYYLVKQLKLTHNGRLSQVVRSMLRDGIGYLVALTLINAVNMYFYLAETSQIQNAFASLGYTVTWIMSQRLILHLHRASLRKRDDQIMTSTGGLVTISRQLTTNRSVGHALRTQFSRKQDSAFTDFTVPEFSMDLERPSTSTTLPMPTKVLDSTVEEPEEQEDVVEVRVEKTFKVSSNSRKVRYELEDYSRGAMSRQDALRQL